MMPVIFIAKIIPASKDDSLTTHRISEYASTDPSLFDMIHCNFHLQPYNTSSYSFLKKTKGQVYNWDKIKRDWREINLVNKTSIADSILVGAFKAENEIDNNQLNFNGYSPKHNKLNLLMTDKEFVRQCLVEMDISTPYIGVRKTSNLTNGALLTTESDTNAKSQVFMNTKQNYGLSQLKELIDATSSIIDNIDPQREVNEHLDNALNYIGQTVTQYCFLGDPLGGSKARTVDYLVKLKIDDKVVLKSISDNGDETETNNLMIDVSVGKLIASFKVDIKSGVNEYSVFKNDDLYTLCISHTGEVTRLVASKKSYQLINIIIDELKAGMHIFKNIPSRDALKIEVREVLSQYGVGGIGVANINELFLGKSNDNTKAEQPLE